MKRPKLNFRFHNPNKDDEALINELLKVCIEANMKKADRAIREAALCDGATYRVIAVDKQAEIAERDNRTLFKMPKGEYEGKSYSIPNKYITREQRECILKLPKDFEIELCEKGEVCGNLTIDEFIKAVSGRTAKDYESLYIRPSEIAKEQKAKSRPKRKVASSQNSK